MFNLSDKVRYYPDFIVRRLCGVSEVQVRVKRLWSWVSGGEEFHLRDADYAAIATLTDRVQVEFVESNGLSQPFSVGDVLKIRAFAERCVVESSLAGITKVLFITDGSLASVRRCTTPARVMSQQCRNWVIADCTDTLDLHSALSYDIIVVREIDAQGLITLLRLQEAGKTIIFDMDEDLFNIPSHHPKARTFTPMDKEIHEALLTMADYASARRSDIAVELGYGAKPVVLPDMVDMDRILPSPPNSSPDRFDVVCFADETQQEDVEVLGAVVDECVVQLPSVHFTFVGVAPDQEVQHEGAPISLGRVHYISSPTPEDYYSVLSHIPMDLALVPRLTNPYNIKGTRAPILEMLAKGVPVLASKMDDGPLFTSDHFASPVKCVEDWLKGIKYFYARGRTAEWQAKWLSELRAVYGTANMGKLWGEEFWTALLDTTKESGSIDTNA